MSAQCITKYLLGQVNINATAYHYHGSKGPVFSWPSLTNGFIIVLVVRRHTTHSEVPTSTKNQSNPHKTFPETNIILHYGNFDGPTTGQ